MCVGLLHFGVVRFFISHHCRSVPQVAKQAFSSHARVHVEFAQHEDYLPQQAQRVRLCAAVFLGSQTRSGYAVSERMVVIMVSLHQQIRSSEVTDFMVVATRHR